MTGTTTRYGFVNTTSSAGRPELVEFRPADITEARKWINYYGNPSTTLRFADGRCLYLVDDYGAMNDLGHVNRYSVPRRKDLFAGWIN